MFICIGIIIGMYRYVYVPICAYVRGGAVNHELKYYYYFF